MYPMLSKAIKKEDTVYQFRRQYVRERINLMYVQH